jgi:hypothetical protein
MQAMTTLHKLGALLIVGAVLILPSACKREAEKQGAAEQLGKQVDQSMEKAGQEVGKALESVGETVKEAGEELKKEAKK